MCVNNRCFPWWIVGSDIHLYITFCIETTNFQQTTQYSFIKCSYIHGNIINWKIAGDKKIFISTLLATKKLKTRNTLFNFAADTLVSPQWLHCIAMVPSLNQARVHYSKNVQLSYGFYTCNLDRMTQAISSEYAQHILHMKRLAE